MEHTEIYMDDKQYNIIDIAKYLINLANLDEEDSITNLKLQKLLYYAQGVHLALYEKPLFEEELEAWDHGPINKQVLDVFQDGKNPILTQKLDKDLPQEVKNHLKQIFNAYGQFTAWKLRDMTHEESPWKDVYSPKCKNGIISKKSLKNYFTEVVDDVWCELAKDAEEEGYLSVDESEKLHQRLLNVQDSIFQSK